MSRARQANLPGLPGQKISMRTEIGGGQVASTNNSHPSNIGKMKAVAHASMFIAPANKNKESFSHAAVASQIKANQHHNTLTNENPRNSI